MFQSAEGERVTLSGYGVELAIKSQEYKAKDDTKVEGALMKSVLILKNNAMNIGKSITQIYTWKSI